MLSTFIRFCKHSTLTYNLWLFKIFNMLYGYLGIVPILENHTVLETCCIFHFFQNSTKLPYEPKFIEIFYDSTALKRPTHFVDVMSGQHRGEYQICENSMFRLVSCIEQLNAYILSPDIQYRRINDNYKEYFDNCEYFFIIDSTEHVVCLCGKNEQINPIVTSFKNLSNSREPHLNIIWNFELVNCKSDEMINELSPNKTSPIGLNDLSRENYCIVTRPINVFSIKLPESDQYILQEGFRFEFVASKQEVDKTINLLDLLETGDKEEKLHVENSFDWYLFFINLFVFSTPLVLVLSFPLSLRKNFSKERNLALGVTLFLFVLYTIFYISK